MRLHGLAVVMLVTLALGCNGNDKGGADSGTTDGGSSDGGSGDAGTTDGGSGDGGSGDGGSGDGGSGDGGSGDGGSGDGGSGDGGSGDGGSGDGGSDGGSGDGGSPCGESGICELVVTDEAVECSSHEPPGWLIATSPEPGVVVVDHDHAREGCCPEFVARAVANLGTMEILVEYELGRDDCDCACNLDLDYQLSEIPPGSYTLIAEGEGVEVEVE